MRIYFATAVLTAISAVSIPSTSEDFRNAKLIDIAPFRESNAPIIAPNNGYPVLISTDQQMMTITVVLDGIAYSANFRQKHNFKSSGFIVGDSIPARLDRDNLVLRSNGNEIKAKVTRRERLEPKP